MVVSGVSEIHGFWCDYCWKSSEISEKNACRAGENVPEFSEHREKKRWMLPQTVTGTARSTPPWASRPSLRSKPPRSARPAAGRSARTWPRRAPPPRPAAGAPPRTSPHVLRYIFPRCLGFRYSNQACFLTQIASSSCFISSSGLVVTATEVFEIMAAITVHIDSISTTCWKETCQI